MAQDDDARVAARARGTLLTFEEADQERVLAGVIGTLPACRVHARAAVERGDAQARVFGQRQQATGPAIGVSFEHRVGGEGLAGLVDVEVDADVAQA